MNLKAMIFSGIGISVLSSPCLSLQTYNLVDHQKTQITISKDQQTRIAIEEDRIQQIFGAEGLFDIQSDDERGQIFLKPLQAGNTKPLSITIVTEGGLTQDLRLMPKDTEAQSILFKPLVKVEKAPVTRPSIEEERVALLKAMKAFEEIGTYDKFPLEKADRDVAAPLLLDPLLIYKNETQTGRVYRLKNSGKEQIDLSEKDFYRSGDTAISLEKRALFPGDETFLYIISKSGRTE